jgi:hypothetical protein
VGVPLKAIEVGGAIDEQRQLQLDEPLPIVGPSRVRVIILIPEEIDIDEEEWLQAAAKNPAFDFLKEPKKIFTYLPMQSRLMTKGKVVLVPFPFDDLSAAKVRSAVCLTDPIRPHRHVILAFIISRMPAAVMDTDLNQSPRDWDTLVRRKTPPWWVRRNPRVPMLCGSI